MQARKMALASHARLVFMEEKGEDSREAARQMRGSLSRFDGACLFLSNFVRQRDRRFNFKLA